MATPSSRVIFFHFLVPPFRFTNRTVLKEFIFKMLKRKGRKVEAINIIFCSDAYLLELNQVHLAHNTLTDIITFELSGKGQPLVSDIYISIERVRENAREFNVPVATELHRVIFHGILHLCGFKDKRPTDKKEMRSMEEAWLKKYYKT